MYFRPPQHGFLVSRRASKEFPKVRHTDSTRSAAPQTDIDCGDMVVGGTPTRSQLLSESVFAVQINAPFQRDVRDKKPGRNHFHGLGSPAEPVEPGYFTIATPLTKTSALARCGGRLTTQELFQQFVGAREKPFQQLTLRPTAHLDSNFFVLCLTLTRESDNYRGLLNPVGTGHQQPVTSHYSQC